MPMISMQVQIRVIIKVKIMLSFHVYRLCVLTFLILESIGTCPPYWKVWWEIYYY